MKALAQAIGVSSAVALHNLLEIVEFEAIIGSVRTTNRYMYVRNTSGGNLAANLGVRYEGDNVGGVTNVFTNGNVQQAFRGITTGAMADDAYGWILVEGQINLGLAAGALRKLSCAFATGVLTAAADAAAADSDVGWVMDDGTAVIGRN